VDEGNIIDVAGDAGEDLRHPGAGLAVAAEAERRLHERPTWSVKKPVFRSKPRSSWPSCRSSSGL